MRIGSRGLPLRRNLRDLLIEQIRVLHIALIEAEVNLQCFIRDPLQAAEAPFFRRIRTSGYCGHMLPFRSESDSRVRINVIAVSLAYETYAPARAACSC